jgi:uncharacterized protein (TIGR02246 family)
LNAVVDGWFAAYCDQDLEAIMDLISKNPKAVFLGSHQNERRLGASQLKSALKAIFSKPKSLSIQVPWVTISQSGKLAWAAADCVCAVKGPRGTRKMNARQTLVLEKSGKKWLIVHSHFSLPR